MTNLELSVSDMITCHGLSKVLDAVWGRCIAKEEMILCALPNSPDAVKWSKAASILQEATLKTDPLRL